MSYREAADATSYWGSINTGEDVAAKLDQTAINWQSK